MFLPSLLSSPLVLPKLMLQAYQCYFDMKIQHFGQTLVLALQVPLQHTQCVSHLCSMKRLETCVMFSRIRVLISWS
jgi:hypothetical protein